MTGARLDPGLLARLHRRGVFARLDPHAAAALFASARLQRIGAGSCLIAQGETDRDYLILLEGELEVFRAAAAGEPAIRVGVVRPGEGVGEMAVLSAVPRAASVHALIDSRLLRIDGDRIDELLSWCAPLGCQLHADAMLRKRFDAMREAPVFRRLPLATMQCVFERLRPIDAAAGTVVVREGEPGDAWYMIECGEATVAAGKRLRAILGPGDTFGEQALLTGEARSATVAMTRSGRLWRLAREDFDESVRAALVEEIAAAEARRLVAAGKAVWLDCRVEEEFAEGHIAGAVPLPINRLRDEAGGLDATPVYIAYCRTGSRGACAAFLLRERGLRACSLAGGLCEWPDVLVRT